MVLSRDAIASGRKLLASIIIVASSIALVVLTPPIASAILNQSQQSLTPLSQPNGLVTTSIGQTEFTANWEAVTNATGYDITVTKVLNTSNTITQNNIPTTFAIIQSLSPGTQYYWNVTAKNPSTISPSSSLVYTWTKSPSPTGITVQVTSPTTANVSWNAAPGATDYHLKFTPAGQTGTSIDVTSTYYSLMNLIPNTGYSITLTSGNPSGYSMQSAPVTFSTSTLAYDGSIGVITFAFGHAFSSELTAMNNVTKYNFAGNISPVETKIGTSGYLTTSQLLALKNSGWQILSHSMTHPQISNSTPASTLQYEIVQSKQDLTNMGFCITGYESPFDMITTNSSVYIKNNYKYAVVNPNHQNTVYSISHDGAQWNFPVAIHYYGVGKGLGIYNFATTKPLIDYAIANHTYLILNFHQIDSSTNPYSTYPSVFWQILKYVKQQSDAGHLKVENSVQALGISCP